MAGRRPKEGGMMLMFMRWWLAFVVVILFGGDPSSAQQTQPRTQASDLTYLGSFTVPDAANGSGDFDWLSYGGASLGLSPRGNLLVGCTEAATNHRVAEVTIPAIGQQARVVVPCTALPGIRTVSSDAKPGGFLSWNGRLIATGYAYYDANGAATVSHTAYDPNTGVQLAPWVRMQAPQVGWVGGQMTPIPQEWRTLMGGPALTSQWGLSIISRTSFGPTASVFNPDDIGKANPVPATMLLGYPAGTWLPYDGAANSVWIGGDMFAGLAFPSGMRSVLFFGMHGNGAFCYGESAECGDPAHNSKGEHTYPYEHRVWAYDANDLVSVKQGKKQPWEIVPYATWTLTEMNNTGGATIKTGGMTYDPISRRVYMTDGWSNGPRRVHVYIIKGASPPPPPPTDCIPGTWSEWTVTGITACTAEGEQQITETRVRTGDIPPTNGGAACPPSTETRTRTVSCTPTTETITVTCTRPIGGMWSCVVP